MGKQNAYNVHDLNWDAFDHASHAPESFNQEIFKPPHDCLGYTVSCIQCSRLTCEYTDLHRDALFVLHQLVIETFTRL